MTGRQYVGQVRELLHDTGANAASVNRRYDTDDILRTSYECLKRVVATQVKAEKFFTINNLITTATGTAGTNVPSDFWILLFGTSTGGSSSVTTYVPAVTLDIADPLVEASHNLIYVRNRVFRGAASVAHYVKLPAEIEDTPVAMAEFNDNFYRTLKFLTAREMLIQEKADALDRYKFLTDLFIQKVKVVP